MRILAGRLLGMVACAGLGAGATFVLRADEKPAVKEKTDDEKWLPKAKTSGERSHPTVAVSDPVSAFPDVALPKWDPTKDVTRMKGLAAYERMRPRLVGKIALRIEATDDTLRKLLKARLHQGVLAHQQRLRQIDLGGPDPFTVDRVTTNLLGMQSVVSELFAAQPKELTPWLEELLIEAKELEWITRLRAEAGALGPWDLTVATGCRLQIETALWKAKNAK